MREDPMSTILFILLQAQLGIRLVAIAQSNKNRLDEPGMADRAVRAWHRGAQVKKDLFTEWDFWPDLERPIDEVRQELGVS
jgi:hypothetical protein